MLAGVLALAAGCSDPKLARMTEVRDAVCKCQDAACVEMALAKMPGAPPRQEQRAQRLAREIMECVAQVGAMEPTPADREPPAEREAPATTAPAK
jgi:hypothetical protein